MGWLSQFLCWIGSHDWREMNGVCRECGYRDPLWKEIEAPYTEGADYDRFMERLRTEKDK